MTSQELKRLFIRFTKEYNLYNDFKKSPFVKKFFNEKTMYYTPQQLFEIFSFSNNTSILVKNFLEYIHKFDENHFDDSIDLLISSLEKYDALNDALFLLFENKKINKKHIKYMLKRKLKSKSPEWYGKQILIQPPHDKLDLIPYQRRSRLLMAICNYEYRLMIKHQGVQVKMISVY